MAIYQTWFVADDPTLDRLFAGWQLEGSTVEPAEPGPLPVHDAEGGEPISPVLAPETDYERYLEETTPPGLAALPHLRWKGLAHDFIEVLTQELAPGTAVGLVRRGPDGSTEQVPVVQGLPSAVAAALAEQTDAQLQALAAELSGGDDDWDDDGEEPLATEQLRLLEGPRELARLATEQTARVCLFMTM